MSEFGEKEPQIDAWYAVERIHMGRIVAEDKESLLEFIEAPLRPAIGAFFDRNIPTIGSSCNINDYYGASDPDNMGRPMAWISLDWTSLSEENRAVIEQYPHHDLHRFTAVDGTPVELAGLFFPIQRTDFPEDIGQRALELAEQFHTQ